MKKKSIVERYEELVPASKMSFPNGSTILFGESDDPLEGLNKIIDDGTTVIELPEDYFDKDENGEYKNIKRTTYPLLKSEAK